MHLESQHQEVEPRNLRLVWVRPFLLKLKKKTKVLLLFQYEFNLFDNTLSF